MFWNSVVISVLLLVQSGAQLLGPKSNPGDILSSVDRVDVSKTLDQVLKAASRKTYRACAMGFANSAGQTLKNPLIWLDSGEASVTPQNVTEGETGLQLFTTEGRRSSTAGVMSYDLADTNLKVAVGWNLGPNLDKYWYNAKVYPTSYTTGEHMYNQMKDYAGPWGVSGWESRVEYGVQIKVTMTSNIEAKLMLFVDSTGLDPEGRIESYIDCAFNAKWFGSYCWRECHNGGYCWVNYKCSSFSDCQGEHPCYEYCKETP